VRILLAESGSVDVNPKGSIGDFMVWRKRKQQAAGREVSGRELSDTEKLSSGPADIGNNLKNSRLGHIRTQVGPEGEEHRIATDHNIQVASESHLSAQVGLTPYNQDLFKGVWQADTREFCLPVSHRISQRPFVIPRNYRISGNLSTTRQVLVHGEFAAGVLDAPTVTVAPSGAVRGSITASNIQISGTVDAKVSASVAVEVSGRGRLAGEIRAPAVKVWPGAALHASKLTVGQYQPMASATNGL
jgi:cytoskeletal protein CcmA (bactofilin family)